MTAVATPQMDGKERMLKYPQLGGPRGIQRPAFRGRLSNIVQRPGRCRSRWRFFPKFELGLFSPGAVMPLWSAALKDSLHFFRAMSRVMRRSARPREVDGPQLPVRRDGLRRRRLARPMKADLAEFYASAVATRAMLAAMRLREAPEVVSQSRYRRRI